MLFVIIYIIVNGNPNEEPLNATRTPRNPKWYERYGKNRKKSKNSKKY